MLQLFLEDIRLLPAVPAAAAQTYRQIAPALVEAVNQQLTNDPEIPALLGGNPLTLMYQNHENHARFLADVFSYQQLELLVRTVPWVYHAYHAHGFSYDYFPRALSAWRSTIAELLPADQQREILAVYRWLLDNHTQMVAYSQTPEVTRGIVLGELSPEALGMLSKLLQGEERGAVKLALLKADSQKNLKSLYLEMIQPAMYEVGALWEKGEVSVAQEHLCSALVNRIMAVTVPRFIPDESSLCRAVVTAAPNEFHEIGTRMVADLLELDGWEVDYLGANTPSADLVRHLLERKPFLLAISVSMPFNIDAAHEMIAAVRATPELQGLRIMVGGRLFQSAPELWRALEADGCAIDAAGAAQLARSWFETQAIPPS